jgi:hypothetical protein
VHIQYGTFGPRIALADITAVEVVDYDALRYGGWGIRRGLSGGMAYSVPGRGGKAVRVTTRDGRIKAVLCGVTGNVIASTRNSQEIFRRG